MVLFIHEAHEDKQEITEWKETGSDQPPLEKHFFVEHVTSTMRAPNECNMLCLLKTLLVKTWGLLASFGVNLLRLLLPDISLY